MTLENQISEEIKLAMHARDGKRLDVLRAIRNEIIKFTKTGSSKKISENDIVKIIKSEIKQRRDAISMFEKGGRRDLIATEEEQIKVLQSFLPEQLSPSDLQNIISAAIIKCGASDLKDMGRVMKEAITAIGQSGKDAENSLVSELVKKQLMKLN